MVKKFVFNFKLDAADKRRLLLVAHHLQRTQADTVRWLIRQAAGEAQGGRGAGERGRLAEVTGIEGEWEIETTTWEANDEPF